jgi:hypothetical protein
MISADGGRPRNVTLGNMTASFGIQPWLAVHEEKLAVLGNRQVTTG